MAEQSESQSWYLDPLVAEHKRKANLELIDRAARGLRPGVVVKTDLFEEANGRDEILFSLDLGQRLAIGFDRNFDTCARARRRSPRKSLAVFVADARKLPLKTGGVDLVVSTSTLDHMDARQDLDAALAELSRSLREGGRLALTLDNPWNPVYPLLRLICSLSWAPFGLGYTASRSTLDRGLREIGITPLGWAPMIHNPRLLSTLAVLGLRRLLGKRAGSVIRAGLGVFDQLGKLPTRWISACFTGVWAEKGAPRGTPR